MNEITGEMEYINLDKQLKMYDNNASYESDYSVYGGNNEYHNLQNTETEDGEYVYPTKFSKGAFSKGGFTPDINENKI
jgi:hypothetical protein